ncbi:MAG: ATP-binding protein [Actinobacteria bacterium]|nr:ATP-binding protein [Actinomycetota bacterium]
MPFVGRRRELDELAHHLDVVRRGQRADRGVCLALRGRRRVGKSRLVTEFAVRSGAPTVYFQAARGADPGAELALFAEAVATSDLPGAALVAGVVPTSLTAALTLLATALPDDVPSVVVLDEVPWLLEAFPGGAGELQRVWDTRLAAKPVLLLLLGGDLAMMEGLARPDQPFHGRATEMVLDPLSPRDVGRMTGLTGADAVDAWLVTGGSPLVAQEWRPGTDVETFLAESFARSTSALVVSGSRVLDGEFPGSGVAHQVLDAIGGRGERTFSGIQRAARGGPLNAATLTATLQMLSAKRVVTADEPLSLRAATKDRRWRVADPALRFWLAFVEDALPDVDRGRPDLALARVRRGLAAWRGRAVEPFVREALERLLPDEAWPQVRRVGGWWPRSNTPEIDLVGADARPAGAVGFVGLVKWRSEGPVSAAEVGHLATTATAVPGVGAGTPLVAVCPAGSVPGTALARTWTADDLLAAWP